MKTILNPKIAFFAVLGLFSCDEDTKQSIRPQIDYALATAETEYSELFVDADQATTVDVSSGNTRHKMFQALNYYSTSRISGNTQIDAATLNALFTNTGAPFTDISTSTISVTGATLNASGINLADAVASSFSVSSRANVHGRFEDLFDQMDAASDHVTMAASQGVAGKLTVNTSSYLVDAKGIEVVQVIQKSLIGALQLDYISNVLLSEGLTADNYSLVSGKNYTPLEQTWDEAYGLLTLNPIYLQGATDASRNTVEFGAGAYLWEYNKTNYAKIFPAFLKGRIAIVNNDREVLEEQALFIRTQLEIAIAKAALGYLDKWKSGTSDAARAHAIGEGLGFIYSLRFATIHNADATFSDGILTALIESPNGFWDLTAAKVNAASDAIKLKFGIN